MKLLWGELHDPWVGATYGQCNPKGNGAPQDSFSLVSCAAPGIELGSPRRSRWCRAGDVHLVSVRLNDPSDLESDSVACWLARQHEWFRTIWGPRGCKAEAERAGSSEQAECVSRGENDSAQQQSRRRAVPGAEWMSGSELVGVPSALSSSTTVSRLPRGGEQDAADMQSFRG